MLGDDILPLLKRHDWRACHALLDRTALVADRSDPAAVPYWRAVVLEEEGRDDEAFEVLEKSRDEFSSKCLPDYLRAKILAPKGRLREAVAILREAPILKEFPRFPALAREAAYYYCLFLTEADETPPPEVLAIIPEDFETLNEGRFVGKTDLLDRMRRMKGAPQS
jgi:tetratricopeptide (TPR) repeat protein